MTAPAGWYPDPAGSGQWRWWDGDTWAGEAAPPSKPPNSRRDRWIALGAIGAFVLVAGIVGLAKDDTAKASTSDDHVITYMVGGNAPGASLTIENDSGGTSQIDVRVPWTTEFPVDRGDFVYLSAQNSSDGGTITCALLLDGAEVQHAESNTAYGIASCSGRV